jgi:hypothetical protein
MQQIGDLVGIDSFRAGTGLAIAVAIAVLVLVVLRRRGWRPAQQLAVVGGLLLALTVAQSAYTLDRFRDTQQGVSQAFLDQRDWVDDRVGDGDVLALHGKVFDSTTGIWWETLTFNQSVRSIATREGDDPYLQTFLGTFTIDGGGTIRGLPDREYLLTSASEMRFALRDAQPLAEQNAVRLYRARQPYRVAWQLEASDSEGHVMAGTTARLRVYGDGRPRRETLTVKASLAPYARKEYALRVKSGARSARRSASFERPVTLRVPVTVPASGSASITLDIAGPRPEDQNPADGMRVTTVDLSAARD